jgi:hypothetical protein
MILKPSVMFKEILHHFSHFFDEKALEHKQLYGYNLAFDLFKEARSARAKHIGKIIIGVSVIRALIPSFYRIYLGEPMFTNHPYLSLFAFLLNTFFFWVNTFILSISIMNIQTRTFCLDQIANLISSKKV